MATRPLPRPPGAQTPQKQHAGLPELDAQPSAASIRPPWERSAEGLCPGVANSHSGRLRGTGPRISNLEGSWSPATEQPGIRGLRTGLPAGNGGYATPAARPVSTTSWRHGLRRTCRLVTGRSHRPRSTWPDKARLAFLAVTHRYKRIHCLWLEQFQFPAESARCWRSWAQGPDECRSAIPARAGAWLRSRPPVLAVQGSGVFR